MNDLNLKEVRVIVLGMGLDPRSISLYSDYDPESGLCTESEDTEFTTCDLSGIEGDCVSCTALDKNKNVVAFKALSSLAHGALGKLTGAF